jgi:hypothetical protein
MERRQSAHKLILFCHHVSLGKSNSSGNVRTKKE